MDIDKYDLNITEFFEIEKLEQAVCGLKPCRPKRFRYALEVIDYDEIVMFLSKPAIFENSEINGIIYWRKAEFENNMFSYKFAILFPMLKAKENDYAIGIYHRGKTFPGINEQIQAVIDQIAEQLILVNEA